MSTAYRVTETETTVTVKVTDLGAPTPASPSNAIDPLAYTKQRLKEELAAGRGKRLLAVSSLETEKHSELQRVPSNDST